MGLVIRVIIHRGNLEINCKGKYKYIRDYLRGCTACNKSKCLGDGFVKIGMLSASRPLDLVTINVIIIDKTSDNKE